MESRTKFLKVRCEKCKNEQIIFQRCSTQVNCLVCNESLAAPTGGKCKVTGQVLEVLE